MPMQRPPLSFHLEVLGSELQEQHQLMPLAVKGGRCHNSNFHYQRPPSAEQKSGH
jgi:hypothetical protein